MECSVRDKTHSVAYSSRANLQSKLTLASFVFDLNTFLAFRNISGKVGCPWFDTKRQTSLGWLKQSIPHFGKNTELVFYNTQCQIFRRHRFDLPKNQEIVPNSGIPNKQAIASKTIHSKSSQASFDSRATPFDVVLAFPSLECLLFFTPLWHWEHLI